MIIVVFISKAVAETPNPDGLLKEVEKSKQYIKSAEWIDENNWQNGCINGDWCTINTENYFGVYHVFRQFPMKTHEKHKTRFHERSAGS